MTDSFSWPLLCYYFKATLIEESIEFYLIPTFNYQLIHTRTSIRCYLHADLLLLNDATFDDRFIQLTATSIELYLIHTFTT